MHLIARRVDLIGIILIKEIRMFVKADEDFGMTFVTTPFQSDIGPWSYSATPLHQDDVDSAKRSYSPFTV